MVNFQTIGVWWDNLKVIIRESVKSIVLVSANRQIVLNFFD